MEFLFRLLDNSGAPWLVLGAALLVGYKYLSERVRIRAPAGVSRDDLVNRVLGSFMISRISESGDLSLLIFL